MEQWKAHHKAQAEEVEIVRQHWPQYTSTSVFHGFFPLYPDSLSGLVLDWPTVMVAEQTF